MERPTLTSTLLAVATAQAAGVSLSVVKTLIRFCPDLKSAAYRHVLTVCTGERCGKRQGAAVLEAVRRELRVGKDGLSADGMVLVVTRNCLKHCGTSPNLLLDGKSPYTVVEADEFDRSFHWLSPYMSVITATDPDHLDIYGTVEAYLESFRHYTSLIQPEGALIVHTGLAMKPDVKPGVKVYTYAWEEGDFHAENIRIGNGEIWLDFVAPDTRINGIRLGVPVYVDIENSVAAMALAHLNGVTDEEIKMAMPKFRGVERRFDLRVKTDGFTMVCDYAHHPAEIAQSIRSVRLLYPDRKITALFQPHLYTRTRDFYREFAESLSLADEVILTDIYPARELPIEGVSSRLIYDCLPAELEKWLCHKAELPDFLKDRKAKLQTLVVLGAGDLEQFLTSEKLFLA